MQFINNKIVFFTILIFSFNNLEAQSYFNKNIKAKINLEKKDVFITLRPVVENPGVLYVPDLSYNFIALKQDKKGSYSNQRQEGRFILKPNEEKSLSEIRLNLTKEENLRTYLFIKYKGKLVAKDSIWIVKGVRQHAKKQNKGNQIENNFVLKGIVLDETLTNIGRNFYEYFYQKYSLSQKKYPFIIKVKEKPGMARSSVISVEVKDKKIYEFFSKPNEEYLKKNVTLALLLIKEYISKSKNILKPNGI